MALLYVQESGLRLLDGAVTLFTVGVSGLCAVSLFLIQNSQSFVTLYYVGRWKSQ